MYEFIIIQRYFQYLSIHQFIYRFSVLIKPDFMSKAINIYIFIYIYIERERGGKGERRLTEKTKEKENGCTLQSSIQTNQKWLRVRNSLVSASNPSLISLQVRSVIRVTIRDSFHSATLHVCLIVNKENYILVSRNFCFPALYNAIYAKYW